MRKLQPLRKYYLAIVAVICISIASQAQYWQQQVNYTIDVSLNDTDHSLSGFEKIVYINHSPDTLHFIWFHLWPNAYKNDRTAFTDQTLENGNTKFYFSNQEDKGYINRLDFKVNEVTANVEDHPKYIDIVKVILPTPLAPGAQTTITTPFYVRLPFNISRGGHVGQSYQATQWYPKPAVYDKDGWHTMPYLDQGEFYSEFGNFQVNITIPKNYVVAATGSFDNEEEEKWLKTRANFSLPTHQNSTKTPAAIPPSSSGLKTLHFTQNNVHDFSWFADKSFIVQQDTCRLPSGKIIEVKAYYTPAEKENWDKAVQFAKDATRFYATELGDYPYPIVQVVQGPKSFGGGMEYPTITVISPIANEKMLDITIAHEIGHNWLYGILASNERMHPWMDEGINSFYEKKYTALKYGQPLQLEKIAFETKAITKTDQPISTPAAEFSETNYLLVAYYKTAAWMQYLETVLGTDVFQKAMQHYYSLWQFKHPQPQDFKKAIEESSGQNVDSVFSYLSKPGLLPTQKSTGSKANFVFNFNSWKAYLRNPTKNLFTFGPAVGYNHYDKLLAGGFITNLKLPPSAFNFFLASFYATGSKKLAGLGFATYSFYPDKIFQRITVGVAASHFTMDEYKDENNQKTFLQFTKLAPGIKLVLKEKNPRSNKNRYIQYKSFFFREDALQFYRDTMIVGTDTSITLEHKTISNNRTLQQLKFVVENNRALYPYRGELKIEQGKYFIRAGFTGKYFFNYPKSGGLSVRLFAGKFIYTSPKTFTNQFKTDRFHLNMTGANGYEDYTYSDYFIGRNTFTGFTSQQIMERDGAFKVRTDLLADKVAKTDDWLIAANFSTTIPKSINPLSVFPIQIPLKLYLDVGTYAEAWKQDANLDHFLYDIGIQIPLLKETVNIYIPLLFSKVYKDYIQSTSLKKERFWKKISFSIDISNFNFRKIERHLHF